MRVEPGAAFEQVVLDGDILLLGDCFSDLVPSVRGILEFRVGGDGGFEFFLIGQFLRHHGGVHQTSQSPDSCLPAVLNLEQVLMDARRVFVTTFRERRVKHFQPIESLQEFRLLEIADVLKLGDGVQSIGSTRMAGDKGEFAIRAACLRPFQIVVDLGRLAVLVNPKERDVEIVARVFEVIRIAAEERGLLLGCKHEPHVGVAS